MRHVGVWTSSAVLSGKVWSARSNRSCTCRAPGGDRDPAAEQERQHEDLEPVQRAELLEGPDRLRSADQVDVAAGLAGPQLLDEPGGPPRAAMTPADVCAESGREVKT
jgi:hypothetical protein